MKGCDVNYKKEMVTIHNYVNIQDCLLKIKLNVTNDNTFFLQIYSFGSFPGFDFQVSIFHSY